MRSRQKEKCDTKVSSSSGRNKSFSKAKKKTERRRKRTEDGREGGHRIHTYVRDTQLNTSEIYIYIRILYVQSTHCVLDLIPVLVLTFSIRIDGNLIQSVICFFRAYY